MPLIDENSDTFSSVSWTDFFQVVLFLYSGNLFSDFFQLYLNEEIGINNYLNLI